MCHGSIAPLVVKAHEEAKCPVAASILRQAAEEICTIAEAVAAKLLMGRAGEEPMTVVLAGGIIASPDSYISHLVTDRLGRTLPQANLRRPTMPPAEAAARLAARLAN